MIELKQALKILDKTLENYEAPTDVLPVRRASNRFLASDVKSNLDLPPFDKSAMDGFAIPEGSDQDTMIIIETVQAGDSPTKTPEPGQCTRIMTGAPVPKNTVQVIPVENTSETDVEMTVVKPTRAMNICRKGEDVVKSQIIAKQGTRIDSLNLSVLISCGVETVSVYKPPRVTVFSTGNELVDKMADWGPGKIFDSNGPMMVELMRDAGVEDVTFRRLPDDETLTRSALSQAIETSDIITFSGGVSAGKFDFIPDALQQCGLDIHFSRIKVKPGKPMTFASGKNTLVFGFPGNPVSTWVMFHLFAWPAIMTLQGNPTDMRLLKLPLNTDWSRKKSVRLEFLPVTLSCDSDGFPRLNILDYHGSAHLSALQTADGLAIIPSGTTSVSAGETVSFWPLKLLWVTRK